MPHSKIVQHYRYNTEIFTLTKECPSYFAEKFRPEEERDTVHWLNYHSIADAEQVIRLCDVLSVDKLTQEDLFKGTKRPRLEECGSYVFFSILSALPGSESGFELRKERISFILGENFLVSFQDQSSDHFTEVRERLEMKKGKIRSAGPDFLLYKMLEAIIDNYIEVVNDISDTIEGLELLVTRVQKNDVLRRIEWQKRKLTELRKIVYPIRELVAQLERTDSELIARENIHYFNDLKDSCLVVIEDIEENKQILEGLANLYYAAQGQKMNEIMKVLTVVSAIFIPLTFIVGVYGMNFEYMPELSWKYGYFSIMGFMTLLSVVLVFVFYKRGWLRRNR